MLLQQRTFPVHGDLCARARARACVCVRVCTRSQIKARYIYYVVVREALRCGRSVKSEN